MENNLVQDKKFLNHKSKIRRSEKETKEIIENKPFKRKKESFHFFNF